MRSKNFFLIFFLGLFVSACSFPSSKYTTAEVIDGDTLVLASGYHLRLIGIDTPEVREKKAGKFVYNPQPYALAAKKFVEEKIRKAKLRVEYDKQLKDQFGRLLGYCFIQKQNQELFLNAEILKAGLAVLYVRLPNIKYLPQLEKAQSQAERAKKGLWSEPAVSPAQAKNFLGQIRTVKGRVYSAYEGKNVILLKLWPASCRFHITIFKDSLPLFQKAGIDPLKFYLGKEISVSGRVRKYHSYYEVICGAPFQIRRAE